MGGGETTLEAVKEETGGERYRGCEEGAVEGIGNEVCGGGNRQ
jgi:hypothetical protein